jgi:hypothetical protein
MTPVLRGSGVLCYVETRVLTRVEATAIDGFMSYETVSLTRVDATVIDGFMSYETLSVPPEISLFRCA